MDGIVERAEHAGDVDEHALLSPALGDGPRGLALEIEDDEAGVGSERLAKVIVAMDADLRAPLVDERLKIARPLAERPLAGEKRRRVVRDLPGQGAQAGPDGGAGAAHPFRDALTPGRRVLGREKLRREGTVARVRAERPVQGRGDDAQPRQRLEHVLRRLGRLVGLKRPQLIENPAPPVAVARHETLEQSQGRPLPGRRSVLDRSGQRRHVRKPGTGGEELADLVVEVEPGLYLSQGLHDE